MYYQPPGRQKPFGGDQGQPYQIPNQNTGPPQAPPQQPAYAPPQPQPQPYLGGGPQQHTGPPNPAQWNNMPTYGGGAPTTQYKSHKKPAQQMDFWAMLQQMMGGGGGAESPGAKKYVGQPAGSYAPPNVPYQANQFLR